MSGVAQVLSIGSLWTASRRWWRIRARTRLSAPYFPPVIQDVAHQVYRRIPFGFWTAAASILLLSTKGRDIIDATGNVFLYKSTNWPGHKKIMIPEGPQHSSVQDIVSWIPK
jgi:hypothetical protein